MVAVLCEPFLELLYTPAENFSTNHECIAIILLQSHILLKFRVGVSMSVCESHLLTNVTHIWCTCITMHFGSAYIIIELSCL